MRVNVTNQVNSWFFSGENWALHFVLNSVRNIFILKEKTRNVLSFSLSLRLSGRSRLEKIFQRSPEGKTLTFKFGYDVVNLNSLVPVVKQSVTHSVWLSVCRDLCAAWPRRTVMAGAGSPRDTRLTRALGSSGPIREKIVERSFALSQAWITRSEPNQSERPQRICPLHGVRGIFFLLRLFLHLRVKGRNSLLNSSPIQGE